MIKDYSELYRRVEHYSDPDLERHCLMMGFIKKKMKKRNLLAFSESTPKYFCFHLKGRYLCYYSSEPVDCGLLEFGQKSSYIY